MERWVEITDGPDAQGRYHYTARWAVRWHPWCVACGRAVDGDGMPTCTCYREWQVLGQCQHGELPERWDVREAKGGK